MLNVVNKVTAFDRKTVAICETQPVTAEGLRSLLQDHERLECTWAVGSLAVGLQIARQQTPDILILDKGFGLQAVFDVLAELRAFSAPPKAVVWSVSMTEADALRLLQVGARGIVRKTAGLPTLLACLEAVAAGNTWMEDCVFRETSRLEPNSHSDLTARENQVLELVEQGLKNRQIAAELGIRPGTVKIHLKHIFEKTGVRGRYGLALNGLKQKGLVSLPPMLVAAS